MAFPVKLAVTVAMMALQVGLQMTQRIKGPRLDEMKVSTADYGTPIPRFWGIRRFECPIIWAEDLREEKNTHKSKGGKYDEYKYYGTFAVAIADHEIDAVTRIWMDRRLVYDTTKAGPISVASIFSGDANSTGPVKLSQGENMRIYLGTETQEVDPRYQAWCEDRYGVGSAPAYRGVSYIVFEDIPLEPFGNRIPQVTVEAVSSKSDAFPYETEEATIDDSANYRFTVGPGGNWLIRWVVNTIEWFDMPSRTYIGSGGGGDAMAGTINNRALAIDGTAYWVAPRQEGVDAVMYLYTSPPLGPETRTASDSPDGFPGPTRVFDTAGGRSVLTGLPLSTGYLSYGIRVAASGAARDFCLHADGSVVKLFHPTGTSSDFTISGPTSLTVTGLVSRSAPSNPGICHVASESHYFVVSDDKWYLIDDTTGAIKSSGNWTGYNLENLPRNNPNATTFWAGFSEWSLADGSLVRTVDPFDWVMETSSESAYDPVNHALVGAWDTHLTWRFLDRIGSVAVTLQTIVDSVCGWCGLSDKDTAALTQLIKGYSVTQGSGKDMIEPLLTIHDVDARPHDFSVQFVNRGSSPSGTLLTEDFVRDGTRYKVTIRQDTDLPKKLTFNFADSDSDQQTNTIISQRPLDAMDSQREETIDLTTYVATASEAQQLGDRYFRRIWNSREEISNALTAQHLALEPGDVTTLSLDGTSRNARLDKMTIAGGRISCVFVRDEASVATLNTATTGPDMGGRDEESIVIPPPVKGMVVDAPLKADADNDVRPLIYVGASTYAGLTFMGAAIYRGDDGTYDDLFATVSTAATWGLTSGVLGDVSSPWLWDRGNTLNVSLEAGTISSATEAAIDADPSLNLILLGNETDGWEYLNFTTATLEADGTYTLSGFKRGRRGTEWATGGHSLSDIWVLASSVSVEEVGTDDVGGALSFKAQSIGRSVETAPAIGLSPYTGASLKPYAPARVKWVYDGTDLQGTLYRRTRVGGSWNGGSTIPLSENSEEYEIDVYNGATLKRTITVSGTNAFTYTAAMATADGITLPTTPTINAYQISDAVGRGFALAA